MHDIRESFLHRDALDLCSLARLGCLPGPSSRRYMLATSSNTPSCTVRRIPYASSRRMVLSGWRGTCTVRVPCHVVVLGLSRTVCYIYRFTVAYTRFLFRQLQTSIHSRSVSQNVYLDDLGKLLVQFRPSFARV